MSFKPLYRIAVFYDGSYFYKVSNYYNYEHPRKARISIEGLHNFIVAKISELANIDQKLCRIVDAHYFRGRLSAKDANNAGKLYHERIFDDILMGANVVTHYLPLKPTTDGGKQEKGIDVWLALEAYELAIYKKFDALVLIACDGDYVPLIRKLNTLGTQVMLLGWDFTYTDDTGKKKTTRTSQALIDEVTHYLPMNAIIEDRRTNAAVENMFLPSSKDDGEPFLLSTAPENEDKDVRTSTIISLKDGYGFICEPPNNIFFHNTSLENIDFNDLQEGMQVKYVVGSTKEGKVLATKVWKI